MIHAKRLLLAALSVFLICTCATTLANAPENLDTAKTQAVAYYNSGHYYHDISVVTTRALSYLKFRIHKNSMLKNPKKLAAVFDIDETSLSNYNDMLHLNFGGTDDEVNALENEGHDPAIPYVLALYNYAKSHGVTCFFITGRRESARKPTAENLAKAGYTGYAMLYLKPNNYNQPSVVPYKSAMRQKIVAMGYDVVLDIGDQHSDLAGGSTDATFKVPNPYYLIP